MADDILLATNRMCSELHLQNKELKRLLKSAVEDVPKMCKTCGYCGKPGCKGYVTTIPPRECLNWKWRGFETDG